MDSSVTTGAWGEVVKQEKERATRVTSNLTLNDEKSASERAPPPQDPHKN